MAETIEINTPPDKKVYFASDFHLGAPDPKTSRQREEKLIRWLNFISPDAHSIFLVGDIFDFWFEYKYTVPKGFIRILGKLAELSDKGIQLYFFTGNHDMWMFDYFEKELNVKMFRQNQEFSINGVKVLVGHGDGLGPGDATYKLLKRFFASKICQFLFSWIHPNIGFWIANTWSGHSRIANHVDEEVFLGDDEWLYIYSKELEAKEHHDYYIFGHRHLPLDLNVGNNARYINLGEWVKSCTYGTMSGQEFNLTPFEAS